jgi:hypothetical protein
MALVSLSSGWNKLKRIQIAQTVSSGDTSLSQNIIDNCNDVTFSLMRLTLKPAMTKHGTSLVNAEQPDRAGVLRIA